MEPRGQRFGRSGTQLGRRVQWVKQRQLGEAAFGVVAQHIRHAEALPLPPRLRREDGGTGGSIGALHQVEVLGQGQGEGAQWLCVDVPAAGMPLGWDVGVVAVVFNVERWSDAVVVKSTAGSCRTI